MSFDLNRRFGLEFEVVCYDEDADAYDVVENMTHSAHRKNMEIVNAVEEYYSNNDLDDHRWHAKSDSSVHSPGFELASPPLRGKEGLEELGSMLEILRGYCTADSSCGLHIHHDARDLMDGDLDALYKIYFSFQPVISYLLSPSRRYNTYCSPLGDIFEDVRDVTSGHGASRDYESVGRAALNLASHNYHGTVEFRQHQGTVDANKTFAWLYFTQALLRYAQRIHDPKDEREIDLFKVFRRIGWTGKGLDDGQTYWAREFLAQRFKYFTGDEHIAPVVWNSNSSSGQYA